jgi:hypothetical protein
MTSIHLDALQPEVVTPYSHNLSFAAGGARIVATIEGKGVTTAQTTQDPRHALEV